MAIVRWTDPFREFAQLQNSINRVLSDAYANADQAPASPQSWTPPVDIFQNGDQEVVLKAEMPDINREDIDITVDNGTLTLRGDKKLSSEVKEEHFHRIERRYGSFSRSFSLPDTVDAAKVAAEYKNGVLTIRLPLREESKPRQIKVDVAAA